MKSICSIILLCTLVLTKNTYGSEQTLYLLRHFEKQSGGSDPALTEVGRQRAEQLVIELAAAGVQEIYSSDYIRTRETVEPLAAKLGLTVKLYDPTKLAELAAILTNKNTTIVVSGHSNTTPQLVRLLGGQAEDMDESNYGTLFKLTRSSDEVVTVLSKIALQDEQQ
jgi:phosphohistidine phosphatase SixA